MKNSRIDLKSFNVTELYGNEDRSVFGGSVFTQVGYWVGYGLEAIQNSITTHPPYRFRCSCR